MALLTAIRQWRPSRLGLKLFVIILSVNVAISASMFLAVSYSIDRGFLDYLNQAQERRATLLADGLVTRWETQQSWGWLEQSPERSVRRGTSPCAQRMAVLWCSPGAGAKVRAVGIGSPFAAAIPISARWVFGRPEK